MAGDGGDLLGGASSLRQTARSSLPQPVRLALFRQTRLGDGLGYMAPDLSACPLMTLGGHPYWKSTPLFIFLHRGVVQGASFRQPRLDEVLPQMVPIGCIFVESQNSWRQPLKRGQRIEPNDPSHSCPGLVRML